MFFSSRKRFASGRPTACAMGARLKLERLEDRDAPIALVNFSGGVLTITGGNRVAVTLNASKTNILVYDLGIQIGDFASASVTEIKGSLSNGNDSIRIAADVTQPTTLSAGSGDDLLVAGGGPTVIVGGNGDDSLYGGSGSDTLLGGSGNDYISAGSGPDYINGGGGSNLIVNIKPTDTVVPSAGNRLRFAPIPPAPLPTTLAASQVKTILQRASAATQNQDAIVAIVDRNGRILGVDVESGVSSAITGNTEKLTFAIDGAVALARTGAVFSNDSARLTSRTVEVLSESTFTTAEVNSDPNLGNTSAWGPGFVAPVGNGGHFPPNVPYTPSADLFNIEATNRDSAVANPNPATGLRGPGEIPLQGERFNIPMTDMAPGAALYAPESWGEVSGMYIFGQSRGIATLPGGLPIYSYQMNTKGTIQKALVGGIGVFFPGTTGYASAENSSLSSTYNSKLPDRTLEAEYIGLVAIGGSLDIPIGSVDNVAAIPGIGFPFNSKTTAIYLAGITLNEIGPDGLNGSTIVMNYAKANFHQGTVNGTFEPVDTHNHPFLCGLPVSSGWIVTPHASVNMTAAEVEQIIDAGIQQANQTRAAIRLPAGSTAKMVFAVTDTTGAVLGLYRMPDATVFSIDVAVAKARNDAYYDDPALLQTQDKLPGVATGTAFTNRTFRYLALPNYPEGSSGGPGVWSILNGGTSSELGYDSYYVGTNFHEQPSTANGKGANENGVVFFPGSNPLYANVGGKSTIIGGLGVSGDGVDQDDVVSSVASTAFAPPAALRSDNIIFRGVRLPYQNFDRNPNGV